MDRLLYDGYFIIIRYYAQTNLCLYENLPEDVMYKKSSCNIIFNGKKRDIQRKFLMLNFSIEYATFFCIIEMGNEYIWIAMLWYFSRTYVGLTALRRNVP